jgi:DNA recombination protein RmuC
MIGVAIDLSAAWSLLRAKNATAVVQAMSDGQAERAKLEIRLEEALDRVKRRDVSLAEANQRAQVVMQQLRAEAVGRAAAEKEAARVPQLVQEVKTREQTSDSLRGKLVQASTLLQQERTAAETRGRDLEEIRKGFIDSFKALANDSLSANNQNFLALARSNLGTFQESARGDLSGRQQAIFELIHPVKLSLEMVDARILAMEKERVGAYEGLKEQVLSLLQSETQLRCETSNLVRALTSPNVRGRWGEIQLQRVVEMAGMLDRCDFRQQASVGTEDGTLRPDMVIQLPGGRRIVVDSKVPLAAYLDAIESNDEAFYKQKMKDHARQIRAHMTALSKKNYAALYGDAPEFVILFLPGEVFFTAALQHDPELIEAGVDQNIIIATPTTLIALLKAIAYGWRQEAITENAHEISTLGKELYKRLSNMCEHFIKLGGNLNRAVESYNKSVGSFESRVLVSARRFRDLGVGRDGEELAVLATIDLTAKAFSAPELAVPLSV